MNSWPVCVRSVCPNRVTGVSPLHLQHAEHSTVYRTLLITVHCYITGITTGADPGFDQGGGLDRDRPKLPTVCSIVVRVKRALFSMGSRACLRAPEALGYFITKYAFSPFWGTFLYYF